MTLRGISEGEDLDPRLWRAADPAAATYRAWTTREEAVLRARYADGGARACLAELPDRSLGSIYQHARKLGLRAPREAGARARQRYFFSEALDVQIRLVYQSRPSRGDINALSRKLMRPRWWISKRAAALGLVVPRYKMSPWSPRELDLLRRKAHRHPEVIRRAFLAAGFRRTTTAIAVKIKRLGLETADPDHYTAHALARLLGVDGKTVTRWIAAESLPAKRRGTARETTQGGDHWWIHRADLRRWILSHAQLVDLRKVERYWFIELLGGVG